MTVTPRCRTAATAIALALALPGAAHGGGVIVYDALDQFVADAMSYGVTLHGLEDFEDGDVAPMSGVGMNDPLDASSNNAVFQTGEIIAGLRIQSNTNGTPSVNDAGTSGPNPAGSNGLVALGVGASGTVTDKCVAPTAFGFSLNSLDVIAIPPTVRGVWMRIADVLPVLGAGPLEVYVFDRDGNLLAETGVDGAADGGSSLGILLTDPSVALGRINIWGPGPASFFGGDEAVYEIGLYGTCPTDLDASGAVGFADLLVLLAEWGAAHAGPPDLDGDGIVGFADLLVLLSAWGACR
jgi:hypothetical protein